MLWCPKCKTEYRDEFAVCSDCGGQLENKEPAPVAKNEPPRPWPWYAQIPAAIGLSLADLLFAAALVGGAFLISDRLIGRYGGSSSIGGTVFTAVSVIAVLAYFEAAYYLGYGLGYRLAPRPSAAGWLIGFIVFYQVFGIVFSDSRSSIFASGILVAVPCAGAMAVATGIKSRRQPRKWYRWAVAGAALLCWACLASA